MIHKVPVPLLNLLDNTICVVVRVAHCQDCANTVLAIPNELAVVVVEYIRTVKHFFVVYFLNLGNILLV